MTNDPIKAERLQPPPLGARIVRSLRFLEGVRGWRRLSSALLPSQPRGAFQVTNEFGVFAGDLSSYMDRQIYLYGDYEAAYLRELRHFLPRERRRTLLDVGANIGTHSLAFAREFAEVHAFEPNPVLWPNFERHLTLNGLANVRLHKVGLGDKDETLPFYLTEYDNLGLGTAAADQVYDVPLRQAGTIRVVNGDAYLAASGVGTIDFVKIDVQGLEIQVLRGLSATLAEHRPYVWLEVNEPTLKEAGSLPGCRGWFLSPRNSTCSGTSTAGSGTPSASQPRPTTTSSPATTSSPRLGTPDSVAQNGLDCCRLMHNRFAVRVG